MGTGTSGSAAAETIPAALANSCADLTTASDLDAVGGRQVRYVAAPASTSEAAAVLRAAAELGLTVLPRGSGSRMHLGAAPSTCDLIVDTRRLNQVIEHAAGDLVVTAQAGVRLDDLAEVLAAADQRLALDPPSTGTIGGLIATGAAGPLRYRYGTPRDLLIGITIVRADGTVAKSGGKVVKNVAGYDLGKLFAGSHGTLGLITQATFRLHPKPETSTWITVECASPEEAAETVAVMGGSPLAPAAIELDWPSAAESISVSVLFEGDAPSVTARADRMRSLLGRGTVGLPSDHTKRPDVSSAHPTLAAEDATQTGQISPTPRACGMSSRQSIRFATIERRSTAPSAHHGVASSSGSPSGLVSFRRCSGSSVTPGARRGSILPLVGRRVPRYSSSIYRGKQCLARSLLLLSWFGVVLMV